MLKNTFCHLKNIGLKKENAFWQQDIFSWDALLSMLEPGIRQSVKLTSHLKDELENSFQQYADGNAKYFANRLSSKELWRLFADFRHSVAYVDIETTGLYDPDITTIALYDGHDIKYYVNGQNLNQFQDDILYYNLLVTYNGKTFDIPIIETFFKMKLDQAHIDLRYVLKSLGYTGGLKSCEKQLGISRGDLDGVDGYFAVLLWNDYCKNKNIKALETLLSYNIEDVINLEKLMVIAFNKKIERLHHICIDALPDPVQPEIPFSPDMATIDHIRYSGAAAGFY
ncbi:MAG: ribonuclease H-like domain-containing protein [Desulfobacteraceae bacterium]|nr:ribonuclease H-like domain-containing protein [Desulfobacteraceae bacterium]MBC2756477.1 ribonuclease H-like domain-containing protein [Desulfobacteraceae bacterium]